MSNNPNGIRIDLDPLRMIFNTDFPTPENYLPLGDPFTNFVRLLSISNSSGVDVLVSLDAITPHYYVAANGFIVRDYCANLDLKSGIAGLPVGTQLYFTPLDAPAMGDEGYLYAEVTYISTI